MGREGKCDERIPNDYITKQAARAARAETRLRLVGQLRAYALVPEKRGTD